VSTVQEYVPQTGKWEARQNMLLPRTDFALCAYGGKIYALGGFQDGALSDVEAYHPISNRWDQQEALSTPLQFLAAAVLNGKILVTGGTQALSDATNRVLIYL
jgi:N-acetylneuraminic acid mutarotase